MDRTTAGIMMNIKEVADRSGLPAKTIRYYEEIGLIRPLRAGNGYRAFRDSDLHKLAFLGRARGLGFSIEECRALMALYEDKSRASADVKAVAERHLAFADSLRMLRRRIELFVNLPLQKIDRLALKKQLDEIGRA